MREYSIDHQSVSWTDKAPGFKTKELVKEGVKLRFAEFSAGFEEKEWCLNGHLGYVLDGETEVHFENGKKVIYRKEDLIYIPRGEEHKHKAIVKEGKKITILFFEAEKK